MKQIRGFATMEKEKQRELAAKGGRGVPKEKRGFSLHPEVAVEAGKKGGRNVAAEDRSFSQNRELAREAGRRGGLAAQRQRREKAREGW